jgi:citrate synthase
MKGVFIMSESNEIMKVKRIIIDAARQARHESADVKLEPAFAQKEIQWPVNCTVGPGLEGAIACESKVGYVNGAKGELIYRGYDIYELCAHSNFEEVSYLLIHGALPSASQLDEFKGDLHQYLNIPKTIRTLMNFPIEDMNTMGALRLGTGLMRQEYSYVDQAGYKPTLGELISADEDSIPMETMPMGEAEAIYRFQELKKRAVHPHGLDESKHLPVGMKTAYHLISGLATVAGAISRLRSNRLPLEPHPGLSHAGNIIYMMTGRIPTDIETRILDVALILHADHGMNASTFAAMLVSSTLSDFYSATTSGIAALNGPLHGGANEQVMDMLSEIGGPENVKAWVAEARETKKKIMGFGHRVYKAYDPRARILGPLAEYLVEKACSPAMTRTLETAKTLENEVLTGFGAERKIFPNVDFYSGIVYSCLGFRPEFFTPLFAVSRISGWMARTLEYQQNNRIFRPRAIYTGDLNQSYKPVDER